MKLRITVIGSSGNISQKVEEIAWEVGREIAKADAVLITGGRGGVMNAVSKGAKDGKGLTVGILPDSILEHANPHIDIAITTGIGYARNFINVCSGDAIISISGGGGTLSEIGFAIALKKPLILLKGTGGVTDLIAREISTMETTNIEVAENASEAIKLIISAMNY